MRRLTLLVAMTLVVLLLALACGDDGEPVAPAAPATAKIAFTSDRDGNNDIYAKAARALGLTTSQVLRFLRSDPHVWRAVGQAQRQRSSAARQPARRS